MTNETKVRLLTIILNAGPKGTDREMLDNLKAVIKSIEGEGVCVNPPLEKPVDLPVATIQSVVRKRAGRPPKKR